VARAAEEGTEFVLADFHATGFKYFKNFLSFHIQGNFQFQKNDIVGQVFFRLGMNVLFFAAPIVDQAVKETGEIHIFKRFEVHIIVLFHPTADLHARDLTVGLAKDGDHPVVIEVKDITDASKDIVVGHFCS
jgi:hypothetical protein